MNGKVYDILRFLLTNESRVISIESLCKKHDVSFRTIKNYLAVIEDFFARNGLTGLFLVKGGNTVFNGTTEQATYLLNLALKEDFYEYKLSPKERRFIICLSLLLADEPITLAHFNNLLFVSRATLIKDIADVSEYFCEYGIGFYENKHRGLLLETIESQRRDAVLTLIRNESIPIMDLFNANTFNICARFLRHKINIDFYCNYAEEALMLVEKHFNFSLADTEFYRILLILCITIARLSDSKGIESTFSMIIDSNDVHIRIAEYLIKSVFMQNDTTNRDILYLASRLKEYDLTMSDGAAQKRMINFYIVVKSFLHKLSASYGVNFSQDYKLQEYLTSHIAGVYRLFQKGEIISNPLKSQVMEKYETDFLMLNQSIDVLEDNMGITFNEDEKCLILIHIIAALERFKQKTTLPNVFIVCDSGLGTSVLLTQIVKKHFKVNILAVLSFHNLKKEILSDPEAFEKQCDFILSTIPLVGITKPWAQIGAMPTSHDLEKIRQLITEMSDRAHLGTEDTAYIKNLNYNRSGEQLAFSAQNKNSIFDENGHCKTLSPEDILLDKNVTDWKEAIATAAKPLIKKQKITENYVQCMINNVVKYGPYIVFAPGVAIAHANSQDGALEFGISLLRLSTPINFGHKENDPVDIIVAFSLDNAEKHKAILFCMMNIFCNKEALKEVRNAKTRKKVIDILKEYEMEFNSTQLKEDNDDL
jgi:mannitol operon transcriptional antiterminator